MDRNQRIRDVMKAQGWSMQKAKAYVLNLELHEAINEAKTIDDLKKVLHSIVGLPNVGGV